MILLRWPVDRSMSFNDIRDTVVANIISHVWIFLPTEARRNRFHLHFLRVVYPNVQIVVWTILLYGHFCAHTAFSVCVCMRVRVRGCVRVRVLYDTYIWWHLLRTSTPIHPLLPILPLIYTYIKSINNSL